MSEPGGGNVKLPIYMDYQATAPLDPRVLEAMMPYLTEKFGNPHSTSHRFGWEAADAVEIARAKVSGLIGAAPEEIFFTSGATESNNLAIKGLGRRYRERRPHIVTVATEHKCVLESALAMEREGMSVTYLGVDCDGLIDIDALSSAITDETLLVSVMAVNNEIGVIQPLKEIGAMCRERQVIFHTDAAQAAGKIPLDVGDMNVDVMSISGHKLYGPKGVGALYVRKKARLQFDPLISGGGQEGGLRAGTLAPAQCVGLGEACRIASDEYEDEAIRLRGLFDRLVGGIAGQLDGVYLNGHRDERFHGNISLSFDEVRADLLLAELRDLAVSSGAACASASREPSYVMSAIGLEQGRAESTLRLGIGRFTSEAEIDYALEAVVGAVNQVRKG